MKFTITNREQQALELEKGNLSVIVMEQRMTVISMMIVRTQITVGTITSIVLGKMKILRIQETQQKRK